MSRAEVTVLLDAIYLGDEEASSELLVRVYEELRGLALGKMAREAPGHTLQATALVHEAWMRMTDEEGRAIFKNRAHFFGAASEAMRRILVDRARQKKAKKRGGGIHREDEVEPDDIAAPGKADELLAVHEALDKLTEVDARKAELVKLRYFVGLSFQEVAEILGISLPTAHRDWAYSRAWLGAEIGGELAG